MNEKINAEHLERAAYVYIRQSSAHQVRHHKEGQRRQYELAEHARGLGFREVIVIDEDLGRSGSGREERPGFGRVLAGVCQGEVGAVLLWSSENGHFFKRLSLWSRTHLDLSSRGMNVYVGCYRTSRCNR